MVINSTIMYAWSGLSHIAVRSYCNYSPFLFFRSLGPDDMNTIGKTVDWSATRTFDFQFTTIPVTTEQFVAFLTA